MTEYNGWTNWETWNTNLWCQEYGIEEELLNEARNLAESVEHDELASTLADWLENRIYEMMNESVAEPGLFRDLVTAGLQEVNWREIAGVAAAEYVDG